ncbi:hypothetical protein OR16_21818 [Cupriavidus basilensis OR16]|uniref:3-keto-5-aminohexanoate cleavage protein n=1 Tax=Cupriavidus basilensis OR16 TaxID=1127483 RepID=H1S8P2_9BURK|nr:3-keto-5-aminohexanoate cleavage protein [Cupriavidus basilensis]EHP41084.1 hypothetical protein OR16_21818 [Cupriavidus basilensis OR16]
MQEGISLWEAAKREMEDYQFVAGAELQPKWDVPTEIAINVAVSGRFSDSQEEGHPTSIEAYVDAASEVIEAGACGVHIDFSMVTDHKGRRLDRDVPPVEAYSAVLDPLRARFGWDFVANLNVLNGSTFDICMSPAREGLAEVAPCAAGHPDAFMVPAVQALEQHGVKPEIVIHSSGEIELAKRKARHMFMMVDQIRQIDPTSAITVCAAGRATLYMTTLATMLGLNIRVGTEDTPWKYPNSDARLRDNLEMFRMARDIAALHGRRPASADGYRRMIGKPARSGQAAAVTGERA